MSLFEVNFILNEDTLIEFLKSVGPHVGPMQISAFKEPPVEDSAEHIHVPHPPKGNGAKPKVEAKSRKPRESKVNNTILAALDSGDKSVGELKDALVSANLAPGSASTSLSMLQKDGMIKKLGGGMYGKTEHHVAD